MIKLKDIIEKYGDYEIDEDKLKEVIVRPYPKTVWDLNDGDEYFFIGSNGIIYPETYDNSDGAIINIYNAFLTKEEAEFELERRKCETIMLKYGTRDMMSLGDVKECKYYIYYNNEYNKIDIGKSTIYNRYGTIYFETLKLAEKVIDEIGKERLKKYVFNVKEIKNGKK